MNKFLLLWADAVAMLLSLIIPLIITIVLKRRMKKQVRAVPVYFLLFGTLAILVHISFHLFEISYHAIDNSLKGTFTYNFRFYSLILMGGTLAYLSSQLLNRCMYKCNHPYTTSKPLYQSMAFIVLVSAPTIALTPIGALPTMGCFISVVALQFVRKWKQQAVVSSIREEAVAVPA